MIILLKSFYLLSLVFIFSLVRCTTCQCDFYKKNCVFPNDDSGDKIQCYLSGSPGEPSLDEILSQTYTTPEQIGCPVTNTHGFTFVIYLESCQENIEYNTDINSVTGIESKILSMNNGDWDFIKYDGNCTPVFHEISSAILDDSAVLQYGSGITIQSASFPFNPKTTELAELHHPATIVRKPNSFDVDGTCNVVNNGMHSVSLLYLILNNTDCVETAVAGIIDKALQAFGPDQLEIMRITKHFEETDPVDLNMQYVYFKTYDLYRQKYPGRALMSCDALNAKKYPPDPINIDNAFLNYLKDLHKADLLTSSIPFQNPDEIEANVTCPESYPINVQNTSECMDSSGNIAPSILVDISCPVQVITTNNVTTNITYVLNPQTNTSVFPTCIPESLIDPSKNRDACPEGYSLEPSSIVCVNNDANTIPSRPLDIVLWDFQGKVTFGKMWPSQAGVVMTVLVFGDRDEATVGNLKDGEVFENYINKTVNERGIYYPDPHLNLLDGSDFYDVAQDEFNCFNKPKPKCPDDNSGLITLFVVIGLTALFVAHHILTTKGKEEEECKVKEY